MIKEIDIREVPGRATTFNNFVEADVKQFAESGWTVAEVSTYKDVISASSAYKAAVKRLNLPVDVTVRSGRLFLMKK